MALRYVTGPVTVRLWCGEVLVKQVLGHTRSAGGFAALPESPAGLGLQAGTLHHAGDTMTLMS